MENDRGEVPASGASLLGAALGAWLIVSSFTFTRGTGYMPQPAVVWNDLLVGLAIGVMGLLGMRTAAAAPNWVQVALGVWLMIAPIVLGVHFNAGINEMVIGGLTALTALFTALAKTAAATRRRTPSM